MTQINWMNSTLDAFTELAPINYYQFKYIIESSSNKNVNINTLCNDSVISVTDLHELIESICPKLIDCNIKTTHQTDLFIIQNYAPIKHHLNNLIIIPIKMTNIIQWNLDGFYIRSTGIQRILVTGLKFSPASTHAIIFNNSKKKITSTLSTTCI